MLPIVWIKKLALPPSGPLLAALACLGFWPAPWVPWAAAACLGFLTLLCTPAVASLLIRQLDRFPVLDDEELRCLDGAAATAVVVLDGGRAPNAREYGGDTANLATFERLRYAAFVQRRTRLPILASGNGAGLLMGDLLRELGGAARWIDDESRNTHENATFSARLLREGDVRRVVLVTHFWHMPRAVAAFGAAGLDVVPAPMGLAGPDRWHQRLLALVPSVTALEASHRALHEWIGLVWYQLRYGHRRH
ncbi:MAG: YdcF family protein [Acidobacteriota bacterium]